MLPQRHSRWLLVAACALVFQSVVAPVARGQAGPEPPARLDREQLPRLAVPMAGAAAAWTAAGEGPAAVTPFSRIAHQSYRDNQAEIYVADDDGSNEVRLTTAAEADIQPDLSRQTGRVAFARKAGDYEIRVAGPTGPDSVQITDNAADDVAPDWSPDETHIVFQSYRDGQAEIYTMLADGTGQTRLTSAAGYDGQPVYSPDGTQIAFVSDRTGTPAIWLMTASGTGAHALTTQPGSFDPTWSPDGTQIAYDADSNADGWQELWLINADGSNAHDLFAPGLQQDVWAGSFSPDGRYLAYTHITYVNYQNIWYWTSAYIDGYVFANSAQRLRLNPSDVAFNPDWQAQDSAPPLIGLTPLGAVSPGPVPLSWTGADVGSAGVRDYDVQWQEGAGAWTGWLTATTATRAEFPGIAGHTYAFRVRGRDRFFNTQTWTAAAATTVETLPPATVLTTAAYVRDTATLVWSALDEGHSGVLNYDVQERLAPSGAWADLLAGTTQTSLAVSHPAGQAYDYRVRARDRAQNVEAWPADSDAPRVVFYDWQIAGALHDSAGAPLDTVQLSASPALLGAVVGGGAYTAFGQRAAGAYPLVWSQPGYGLLPTTVITPQQDLGLEVALPPSDSVIWDGQFESVSGVPGTWQTTGDVASGAPHTGGSGARLGAAPAPSWGAIESVAGIAGEFNFVSPSVVVDSAGGQHLLWLNGTLSDTTTAVYYANKPLGGVWSAPVAISTEPVNFEPALAIDGANTLHAVWRTATAIVYASRPAAGAWSVPLSLSNLALTPLELVATATGDLTVAGGFYPQGTVILSRSNGVWDSHPPILAGAYPSLALDSAGGVHLVTSQEWGHPVLYTYRPLGGGWGRTEVVFADDPNCPAPAVAVDADGRVHVVACQGVDTLQYRIRSPEGIWGPIETLGGDALAIHPALVASGNLVSLISAYRPTSYDNYVLAEQHRTGDGPWSDLVVLATQPSVYVSEPSVFGTPGGGFYAAWLRYESVFPGAVRDVQVRGPRLAAQTASDSLSQVLTIPITQTMPTLAFFYQLGGVGPGAASALDVRLTDAGGQNTLLHTQAITSGWSFQSFDVSAWIGQTVTVTVALQQAAGQPQAWALVDDLTLGSVAPDVWVAVSDAVTHRGSQVTYTLRYGNQGAPPANAVRLHVVLPAGVAFVSASVAPGGTTPDLWWDLGTLAGRSGPFTLTVTGQTATDAMVPARWVQTAVITTTSPELQTPNNTASGATVVAAHTLVLPSLRR